MTDCISREVAMSMPWANGQYDHEHANEHFICGLETYKEWLEYVPAADVRPVVHGEWVHGREVDREYLGDCLIGIFYDRWTCSECGYIVNDHAYSRINYNFCPNCGADMRR